MEISIKNKIKDFLKGVLLLPVVIPIVIGIAIRDCWNIYIKGECFHFRNRGKFECVKCHKKAVKEEYKMTKLRKFGLGDE